MYPSDLEFTQLRNTQFEHEVKCPRGYCYFSSVCEWRVSICMVMEILKSLGNIKDHLQLACPSGKTWKSWQVLTVRVLSQVSNCNKLIDKINPAMLHIAAATDEFHKICVMYTTQVLHLSNKSEPPPPDPLLLLLFLSTMTNTSMPWSELWNHRIAHFLSRIKILCCHGQILEFGNESSIWQHIFDA